MVDLITNLLPENIFVALGALVMLLLALAFLIQAIIQELKRQGWIHPDTASAWASRLSAIIIVLTFLALNLFGEVQADITELSTWAEALVGLLFSTPILTIVTKLVYEVGKWAGFSMSFTNLQKYGRTKAKLIRG